MRLLFAMTVCCFCAVLWVALAMARRIRRGQMKASDLHLNSADIAEMRPHSPTRSDGRETVPHHSVARHSGPREFFEAGQFRTPRPLRLEQEIFQQKPRRPLSEMTFPAKSAVPSSTPKTTSFITEIGHPPTSTRADIINPRTAGPIPIRPSQAYASVFGQTVPISNIEQMALAKRHLDTNAPEILPPLVEANVMPAPPASLPLPFTLHRRPPQSVGQSGLRRRIDLSGYSNDMGDLTDPYTSALRGSGTQGPVPITRRDL